MPAMAQIRRAAPVAQNINLDLLKRVQALITACGSVENVKTYMEVIQQVKAA
jgi:hypothetical protein